MRNYSLFDHLCMGFDQALKTLSGNTPTTGASYPAQGIDDSLTETSARKHAAGLMRVNHAGEICAQALYHGQGFISRSERVKEQMRKAAEEEGDHLAWCQTRLTELGSHPSYLNPLWYAGSFAIGLSAGMIGDAWSLGFIVETERQVIKHLQGHCQQLPKEDGRSQAILQQMSEDEAKHRDEALQAGAEELPFVIKKLMSYVSKVMVKTAYWI